MPKINSGLVRKMRANITMHSIAYDYNLPVPEPYTSVKLSSKFRKQAKIPDPTVLSGSETLSDDKKKITGFKRGLQF